MRQHEAEINLNECRENPFVAVMRGQFGRKRVWITFTITNWETHPPEREAGFPESYSEVTGVQLDEVSVYDTEADDYIPVEIPALSLEVRDELVQWALDVCDNNPDWVERLEAMYGKPTYEERE